MNDMAKNLIRSDNSSTAKIALINDALIAERMKQVAARLEQLESNQLTKWDVATVVSLIVAGIFTVVAATYASLDTLGVLAKPPLNITQRVVTEASASWEYQPRRGAAVPRDDTAMKARAKFIPPLGNQRR